MLHMIKQACWPSRQCGQSKAVRRSVAAKHAWPMRAPVQLPPGVPARMHTATAHTHTATAHTMCCTTRQDESLQRGTPCLPRASLRLSGASRSACACAQPGHGGARPLVQAAVLPSCPSLPFPSLQDGTKAFEPGMQHGHYQPSSHTASAQHTHAKTKQMRSVPEERRSFIKHMHACKSICARPSSTRRDPCTLPAALTANLRAVCQVATEPARRAKSKAARVVAG